MTEHDIVWYGQSGLMVIVTGLMFLICLRAIRWTIEHRADHDSEHGSVIATVALIVGIGNIITTYATASYNDWLRDTGGELTRAAIIVGTLYMLAWGPGRVPVRYRRKRKSLPRREDPNYKPDEEQ